MLQEEHDYHWQRSYQIETISDDVFLPIYCSYVLEKCLSLMHIGHKLQKEKLIS